MTNKKISKLLYEISQLLELTDVSRFEVIAYQNASRIIDYFQGSVLRVYKKEGIKGLQEIEGIGETISNNIAEYIERGKSSKIEKLQKEIPKIKIEINNIPGIGPKTTNKIYDALKPKNMADLAKKVTSPNYKEKLSAIRIKEKTIQNILSRIKLKDKENIRIPYKIALPIAEIFLEYIKKIPGVKEADIAGSLRRKKETIADIDIVAGADNSAIAKIINSFTGYPGVQSVIAKGTTKASVYVKEGIQVDLEILPLETYGNLLQHFTGSKEHNVKLRTYARQHGFSISEHGIKLIKKGKVTKMIRCRDEKCVYDTLGMKYIPPVKRIGANEIDLALN